MKPILILSPWLLLALAGAWGAPAGGYSSPYSMQFSVDRALLTADWSQSPRSDPTLESDLPYSQWYDASQYTTSGRPWGPHARLYPPPLVPPGISDVAQWKRERVLAVAQKYIGYDYQHHHIPDWDPPAGWPWVPVRSGRNGKGFDCSDFTSFCYNYGLGLKLPTGIRRQAALTAIPSEKAEGPPTRITRLSIKASVPGNPTNYMGLRATLETGDLLFIRGSASGAKVTHVVIWVGTLGIPYTGDPLVIDSHGAGVVDSKGVAIPPGVQIRPFRQNSWYHKSFDHALRLI